MAQTDTHPDIERVQTELFRRASVARRTSLARSLSRTTLQLAWRAVQRACAGASPHEQHLRFVALHYGVGLADQLRAREELHHLFGESVNVMNDFLVALTPVVEILDQLGIAYYIGGSLASSAYGIARATADIDLVADIQLEHVPELIAKLQGDYYIDAAMINDAIARRASFNLLHLATMIKLDIFLPKNRAFDQEMMRRVQQDTLEEVPTARQFNLAAPEDIILTKMEWFRAGNEVSERQWSDILGVLKTQGALLDRAYLERWAGTLHVADLLERAWREASG